MTWSETIDNTVSKDSAPEEMSISAAYMEDAVKRGDEAISTESIEKGTCVLETYEVISEAIQGGMGSVWKVHHRTWDADLAMKRPKPRFFTEGSAARKQIYLRECESWINLGLHPNIVACYYVREIGGVPTIFSEWMDGGSLKDSIQDGSLYEGTDEEVRERILDIAIQTARGLAYSHGRGLIHQDIKPGNILLTRDWDAKVADFGLTLAQGAPADGGSTLPSGYTPAYCPREQAEGEKPAPWMDVYALALTMMEMYAGKRTWQQGADAFPKILEAADGAGTAFRVQPPRGLINALKADYCSGAAAHRDISEAEQMLEELYREETGAAYPRRASRGITDTAGFLNNRALSFLDLGMEENAEKCWKRAMEADRNVSESAINYALYEWRKGRQDDRQTLERFDRLYADSHETVYRIAKTEICIEAGYDSRAAEAAAEVEDGDSKRELIGKIEAMPHTARIPLDFWHCRFHRISTGDVFVNPWSSGFYAADSRTGAKREFRSFESVSDWAWMHDQEDRIIVLDRHTLCAVDLGADSREQLLPREDILSFLLDRENDRIWCAAMDGTVLAVRNGDRSIQKTFRIPGTILSTGHYPERFYGKREKGENGEEGYPFILSGIKFELYDSAIETRATYTCDLPDAEWEDEEEASYYPPFDGKDEELRIVYYDRKEAEERDLRSLQGRKYMGDNRFPASAEDSAGTAQDAWHERWRFHPNDDEFRDYQLLAPGSDQVMLQYNHSFIADPKRNIFWIGFGKHPSEGIILPLPETIQKMPWRLCRIQEPKSLLAGNIRASEIEKAFRAAVDAADFGKAVSLYDEYGELPGYAFSAFEQQMEDELAKHCIREGVKDAADCTERISREQVMNESAYEVPTPEVLGFVREMNGKHSRWGKRVRIGNRLFNTHGYKLLCVMRDRNTILVQDELAESALSRLGMSDMAMMRRRLIRIQDSRVIAEALEPLQGCKHSDEYISRLSMTPDNRWLFVKSRRYDTETMAEYQTGMDTLIDQRKRNHTFTSDSRFMYYENEGCSMIISLASGERWVFPEAMHRTGMLVFSRDNRYLVKAEKLFMEFAEEKGSLLALRDRTFLRRFPALDEENHGLLQAVYRIRWKWKYPGP